MLIYPDVPADPARVQLTYSVLHCASSELDSDSTIWDLPAPCTCYLLLPPSPHQSPRAHTDRRRRPSGQGASIRLCDQCPLPSEASSRQSPGGPTSGHASLSLVGCTTVTGLVMEQLVPVSGGLLRLCVACDIRELERPVPRCRASVQGNGTAAVHETSVPAVPADDPLPTTHAHHAPSQHSTGARA